MEAGRRALASIVLLSAVAVGGCTSTSHSASPEALQSRQWHRIELPDATLRAITHCDDGWYAVGATTAGGNHPALWFSADGRSFRALRVRPISVYGPQNVLYSVACDSSHVVAVGAAIGGAHGNPRTSTWVAPLGPDATLTEVNASFETYGGPDAVGVGPVSAGPRGFLIVGGRVDANGLAGAAVWQSPNGESFRLVDDDPALESGTAGNTEVHGAYVGPDGFVAVGGIGTTSRDPAVWTSPDGLSWHRVVVPPSPADDVMEKVIATSDGLLAIGAVGSAFGIWTAPASGTSWSIRGRFGEHPPATSLPRVIDLASAGGDGWYAAIYTGSGYQLWSGTGATVRQVALPSDAGDVAGVATDPATGTVLIAAASGGLFQTG